jgi:hypothetical protein
VLLLEDTFQALGMIQRLAETQRDEDIESLALTERRDVSGTRDRCDARDGSKSGPEAHTLTHCEACLGQISVRHVWEMIKSELMTEKSVISGIQAGRLKKHEERIGCAASLPLKAKKIGPGGAMKDQRPYS